MGTRNGWARGTGRDGRRGAISIPAGFAIALIFSSWVGARAGAADGTRPTRKAQAARPTAEAGETPAHFEKVTDIFDRADRALMRSKAAGRNQVTVCRRAA